MVKFNIVKVLKAGKVRYAAKSSSGTIRRDTLEELEDAIKDYNQRIENGDIHVSYSEEEGSEGTGEEESKGSGEETEEGLEKLGLSSRTAATLVGAGIETTAQLKSKSRKELEDIKGIGLKSIEEIEGAIGGWGDGKEETTDRKRTRRRSKFTGIHRR